MVFSSLTFFFYFFPAFLILYTILPFRNATIILFSVIFYAWGEQLFILVLMISVVLNYFIGKQVVEKSYSPSSRKIWLAIGITVNLLVLAHFKYFAFIVSDVFGYEGLNPEWVPHLPLGISFFTFQSISYLIDIYRQAAKPAASIWNLAIYIMMFPQLIAGPIVRYHQVSRQIRHRVIHLNYIRNGLLFFAIGLAQKVLIANNVGKVADDIFALSLDSLNASITWLGTVAYTQQIYFDFCGYSNMAIGIGLLMGFEFPLNFNYPYISRSITEFWRRWHISLSSWFRDYLYIPLGGNRKGPLRTYFNLFVVFFLCGLWHGASWTFVIWGMYHGVFLVMERLGISQVLAKAPKITRHVYALLVVMVGWVIFRSESMDQTLNILGHMFALIHPGQNTPYIRECIGNQQIFFMLFGAFAATPLVREIVSYIVSDRVIQSKGRHHRLGVVRNSADFLFISLLLFICAMYISADTFNPFIYYRF